MHSQNTHMLIDEHIWKHWLIFLTVCHGALSGRATEKRVNLSLYIWNDQHGYLDQGLFISQSILIFTSNSHNWGIKHQVGLFINAAQTLSLKEPFRMKTSLKYQRLRPLIFLSPISFLLSLSPSLPSLCFLQVSTGTAWRTRPPQWVCPTCRPRGGGWGETRTARPSAPSPRCPWEPSCLTGKDVY